MVITLFQWGTVTHQQECSVAEQVVPKSFHTIAFFSSLSTVKYARAVLKYDSE
ncbi:MAG TPA: hypothetical protein VKY19_23795 [Ktedonosporobacter sp.]|jgi:hypothetical protein|nr:hypothetical protein [Ktedonosporobacter sp.]